VNVAVLFRLLVVVDVTMESLLLDVDEAESRTTTVPVNPDLANPPRTRAAADGCWPC
jgi:hypothetical protein